MSRLIDVLAADAPKVLPNLSCAMAAARARVWQLAAHGAPDHAASAEQPVVIDLDAHLQPRVRVPPVGAWIDHGPDGTGEPAAMLLRPCNAARTTPGSTSPSPSRGSLSYPPRRPGRRVLVRADGDGVPRVPGLSGPRRAQCSVGFGLSGRLAAQVDSLPDAAWSHAYDADCPPKDGAKLAELTGLFTGRGWPAGMRFIVSAERPHLGAQLRFTDSDGWLLTAFAINTARGQLAQRHAAAPAAKTGSAPRKRPG